MVLEGQVSLTAYFADITREKQVAASSIFGIEIIVADSILVSPFRPSDHHVVAELRDQLYRLYHVWKPHWWICIPPGLMCLSLCSTFRSVSSVERRV